MSDLGRLRALAEAAIPGQPRDCAPTDGTWEPHFTIHGDPFVVEKGRGRFATVAEVGTQPADYGRARAEYIAAADPRTILDLIGDNERLRAAMLAALRLGDNDRTWGTQAYLIVHDALFADGWVAPPVDPDGTTP